MRESRHLCHFGGSLTQLARDYLWIRAMIVQELSIDNYKIVVKYGEMSCESSFGLE